MSRSRGGRDRNPSDRFLRREEAGLHAPQYNRTRGENDRDRRGATASGTGLAIYNESSGAPAIRSQLREDPKIEVLITLARLAYRGRLYCAEAAAHVLDEGDLPQALDESIEVIDAATEQELRRIFALTNQFRNVIETVSSWMPGMDTALFFQAVLTLEEEVHRTQVAFASPASGEPSNDG